MTTVTLTLWDKTVGLTADRALSGNQCHFIILFKVLLFLCVSLKNIC